REALLSAARGVVALGWGIDLVAGYGSVISGKEAGALPGERWWPTTDLAPTHLRVPAAGTVEALMNRHREFLGRLDASGFRPVSSLSGFATVGYRRDTDVSPRPFAAFEIWK